MGIKRNEVAEPQWKIWDYAIIDKEDLFSKKLWKHSLDWWKMLKQIDKIEQLCQQIDASMYPSRLFSAYIDLLEANLYILDDIFYYETGKRIGSGYLPLSLIPTAYSLRFWSLDCHKTIEKAHKGLERIKEQFMKCLKQKPLSEIADIIIKNSKHGIALDYTTPPPYCEYPLDFYAFDAYRDSDTDKDALVKQIDVILNIIDNYAGILMFFIDERCFSFLSFEDMLSAFRDSEKGENLIKPWRCDLEGTRDSLIAKMEKDLDLGPWVNRYTHSKEAENILHHLFFDDRQVLRSEEEMFNTDNWIRIFTIAAVLEEYDEHQADTAEASAKEEDTLLRLSLYIKENQAEKFLKSAHKMKTDKEIIALVSNYYENHLIAGASTDLWKVLYDAKLYSRKYSNWRDQLNKSQKKKTKKIEKLD
jgi:hypothetical protein